MPQTRVEFPGAGGQALAGRLHLPAGPPRAVALFAHCFTCTKNIRAAVKLSEALAGEGLAVLRFDFTGLGESEGDFADTTFSSNVEDLVAAAGYLRDTLAAPRLLVGHSLGGAAVLRAAHQVPECVAVATLGAPYDPVHVREMIDRAAPPELAREGEAQVLLAGRPFRIKQAFLDDLSAQRSDDVLSTLGRALLVMHSPLDDTVGIDNARALYQAARHPKSFVSLDDADHLLGKAEDAAYAARVLAAWASRYLPPTAETTETSGFSEAGEPDAVVVRGGAEGFIQAVLVNQRHRLVADEPAAVGGTDAGPAPYDLVLAGLGACTSMTLRMYAARKGLSLSGVRVTLRHAKVPGPGGGKIDRIDRVVELTGELSPDERTRLLEIADRCPVHRTLTGVVQVSTRPA